MNNNKQTLAFSRLGSIGLPVPTRFASLNTVDGKYIPYSGNGLAIPSTNTYPQTLADIAANSPTHGAALGKKALLTYGQGMDFDLLPESLVTFLLNVNDNDESINDIINKMSFDLPTYGGIALKVSWNFNKTINSIEHVPFKDVRLGIPVDGKIQSFVISNDWEQKMDKSLRVEYRINRFNADKINEPTIVDNLPVGDDTTLENASQLVYFKAYSTSDQGFYPIPDYISCLDAAFTEETVGISMRNQIVNGINGAYIISTEEATILDDESKQLITQQIANFATGPQNAGGIMFMPANVKVSNMEALPSDVYTEVNSEVRQRIISAHGIPAILVEYSQGGGFNNRADEMTAAIISFQNTTIKGYQQQILRVLNGIFDYVTTDEYNAQITPFSINFDETTDTIVTDQVVVEDSTSLSNS